MNTPLSQIEVKFKSLADGNTAGNGVTRASIVCFAENGTTVIAANTENPNADPALDDFDEEYGNGTTTLVPNTTATAVYTCKIHIDP